MIILFFDELASNKGFLIEQLQFYLGVLEQNQKVGLFIKLVVLLLVV